MRKLQVQATTRVVSSPKPLVVVAGTFQRGKSTLINGLIGRAAADVGEGIATTHGWTLYRAGARGGVEAVSPNGQVVRRWPGSSGRILQHVDLADIPGFDAGGVQGEADAAAADAALSQADIVLYVTNQSGLGGSTERSAFARALKSNHPIVISLQNVFVRGSVTKRNEWLKNLEKQLMDIGLVSWPLRSQTRALSINALQFCEATGTVISAVENFKKPESIAEATKWRKDSGLEPLIEFLSSADPRALSAVELCNLRRATVTWASDRAELVQKHLNAFIKPCQ